MFRVTTYLAVQAIIYTVSGKKSPQYFRHNFNKVKHSFVIFGTNYPDTSMLNVRKLSPTLHHSKVYHLRVIQAW